MPNIRETWQDPDDDWDDEGDDFDSYDEEDDEEPTVTCPYCRAEVWEEASQCPECGEYLSLEDQQARHQWQPRWIVLTAVLLLLIVMMTILAF